MDSKKLVDPIAPNRLEFGLSVSDEGGCHLANQVVGRREASITEHLDTLNKKCLPALKSLMVLPPLV